MNIINAFLTPFVNINNKIKNVTSGTSKTSSARGEIICNKFANQIDELITQNKKSIKHWESYPQTMIPINTFRCHKSFETSDINILFRSEATDAFSKCLEITINSKDLIFGQLNCKFQNHSPTKECWLLTSDDISIKYYWILRVSKGFLIIAFDAKDVWFIDNFSWEIKRCNQDFRYATSFENHHYPIIRTYLEFDTVLNDVRIAKLLHIPEHHRYEYNGYLQHYHKFEERYITIVKDYNSTITRNQIMEDIKEVSQSSY